MNNFSLSVFLDGIFVAVVLFLLFSMLFMLFLPPTACYVLALCLAIGISIILYKFMFEKKSKLTQQSSLLKKAESLAVQLNLMTHTEVLNIFERAYKALNKCVKKQKGVLIIEDEKLVILPKFSFDGISKTDLVKANTLTTGDYNLYVYSGEYSTDFTQFASRFLGVTLIPLTECYQLLEKTDTLPEFKYNTFPKKQRPKILNNVFQKKRAKNFLAFGIFFLISSYFVPLKTYYIISGAVMLIIALLSKIYGKTKA